MKDLTEHDLQRLVVKMQTPNKKAIVERATELWRTDQLRSGSMQLAQLNPEIEELRESGYLSMAQSDLLRNFETKNAEWQNYNERIETLPNSEKSEVKDFFDVAQALDTGFFCCGTSQIGKSTLAKWISRRLIQKGVVVYVFDISKAWLKDTPIETVIEVTPFRTEYTWLKQSAVFDIKSLSVVDRIRFVNEFCKILLNSRKLSENQNDYEFLIFEECQMYIPEGSLRLATRKRNLAESIVELVTVGANYNLRFGLITQFPAMVDKALVKITQQRYMGWTWEKNDVAYLKAMLGKEWTEKLKTLDRGEFLYQNRDKIQKIQVMPYNNKAKTESRISQKLVVTQ